MLRRTRWHTTASPPNALPSSSAVAPASVAGATISELTILIIGCRYIRESRMPSRGRWKRVSCSHSAASPFFVVATPLCRHAPDSHAQGAPRHSSPPDESARCRTRRLHQYDLLDFLSY